MNWKTLTWDKLKQDNNISIEYSKQLKKIKQWKPQKCDYSAIKHNYAKWMRKRNEIGGAIYLDMEENKVYITKIVKGEYGRVSTESISAIPSLITFHTHPNDIMGYFSGADIHSIVVSYAQQKYIWHILVSSIGLLVAKPGNKILKATTPYMSKDEAAKKDTIQIKKYNDQIDAIYLNADSDHIINRQMLKFYRKIGLTVIVIKI